MFFGGRRLHCDRVERSFSGVCDYSSITPRSSHTLTSKALPCALPHRTGFQQAQAPLRRHYVKAYHDVVQSPHSRGLISSRWLSAPRTYPGRLKKQLTAFVRVRTASFCLLRAACGPYTSASLALVSMRLYGRPARGVSCHPYSYSLTITTAARVAYWVSPAISPPLSGPASRMALPIFRRLLRYLRRRRNGDKPSAEAAAGSRFRERSKLGAGTAGSWFPLDAPSPLDPAEGSEWPEYMEFDPYTPSHVASPTPRVRSASSPALQAVKMSPGGVQHVATLGVIEEVVMDGDQVVSKVISSPHEPQPIPAPLLSSPQHSLASPPSVKPPTQLSPGMGYSKELLSAGSPLTSIVRRPAQSIFENAHGFVINKQNITVGSSKSAFDYLQDHIAVGAAFNSDERCDAPQCHPDTRVAVQQEILSWIRHGDEDKQPRKIMWLTGPAGAGKSAIAGTVAEVCHAGGLLAGSFFFSSFAGSADRRSKRFVIPTLAYQLGRHPELQSYAERLLACIESDPTIFRHRLSDQAETLILRPLREASTSWDPLTIPRVIVIDGVDEVEAEQYHDPSRRGAKRTNEDDQTEILSVLLGLGRHPSFPFRILISCRPERAIENLFVTQARDISLKIFLDSKYDPDADILLFLQAKFAEIRRRYGLSPAWPTQESVKWIVDKSSGQFIFAMTVIRFVADSSNLPQTQLEQVMSLEPLLDPTARNPFGPLDALYTHVFRLSPNPGMAVRWILAIEGMTRYGYPPASFWRVFLESTEGEASHTLDSLVSFVSVPTIDDTKSPFKLYHKSLLDFLSDKNRCSNLYTDKEDLRRFVAGRFISVLQNKGPTVPLSSKKELATFLGWFFDPAFGELVSSLSPPFADAFASCDAVWWIELILTGSLDPEKPNTPDLLTAPGRTLYHLYTEVHKQLCRESWASTCSLACRHWTRHLLEQCNKFDFCVHRLEDLSSNERRHLSVGSWEDMTVRSPETSEDACDVCRMSQGSTSGGFTLFQRNRR